MLINCLLHTHIQEFDQSESSLRVEMTLDGKKILKEGWLTFFKSRKPGLFSSKPLVGYNLATYMVPTASSKMVHY